MTAQLSEFVEYLQGILESHGDIPVYEQSKDDDYPIHSVEYLARNLVFVANLAEDEEWDEWVLIIDRP